MGETVSLSNWHVKQGSDGPGRLVTWSLMTENEH